MNGPAPTIRAVVVDLDDTLYDCFTQCVGPAHREAARAMVEAGARATVDEVLDARMSLVGVEHDLDDAVAACFRAVNPARVAEAGRRAFYDRDPGPLVPYPFAAEVLRRVRATARLVLLSMGHPGTQDRKVKALGLEGAFDEVLLDDVFTRRGKEELLRAWLARSGLAANEVLVVGDRPDAEIAAATRLGMQALRIRGGEFGARPTPPGVPEAADLRAVLAYLGLPAIEAAIEAPTPAPADERPAPPEERQGS
jgi:FMN phosphatase YigB (HAD superfamily)